MAESDATAAWQAQLAALRARGADQRDPVGFATLDALARRAASQPAILRQTLLARLNRLADELSQGEAEGPMPAAAREANGANPLADLLAYIGQQAPAHPGGEAATVNRNFRPKSKSTVRGQRLPAPELKAVAYFRNEWSKLSAEQQLTQTLAQAPENAGPMNSQHLVLRSLQVMRDLAPDYLQGFMSYVDALIWLEQADPTRTAAGDGDKTKAPRRKATRR